MPTKFLISARGESPVVPIGYHIRGRFFFLSASVELVAIAAGAIDWLDVKECVSGEITLSTPSHIPIEPIPRGWRLANNKY